MFEEGFSTQAIFDTKNQEFLKEDKYLFIKNFEVYHTKERIIGFFPFYDDRVADKKIKQDSYYINFISNLSNYKKILKQNNIELKKDIINLEEPLNNIKVVYDQDSQNITSIKITYQNKPLIFGKQIDNKDMFKVLFKKNYFINGIKTTYLNSNDGIPNLSYIKCYFYKMEEKNKFFSSRSNSYCFSALFNLFSFFIKFIFYIIYFLIKLFLFLIKLLLILFVILFPPLYIYWKTQNIYSGNFDITKANSDYEIINNDTIKIYTDEYGFPHIKANSLEDVYFGLGFTHAKNRLWQIDINRRIARGMLSEIFGEKTLETDKFMRKIGHNEYGIKQAKFVENNSEYYKSIKAFISGINYYAKNFKLPIEYYITNSEFKNYTLEDIIASISMFSMAMCQDFSMETWYEYMQKIIGKEMAEKIIEYRDEGFPYWNTTIITDDELKESFLYKFKENKDEININKTLNKNKENTNTNNKEETKENFDDSMMGNNYQTSGASNCWNIDGSLSSSGKPLLCNDPHLPNGMPGMFFVAKLYLPDGNIISGATLPGAPVIITGSNSYISWGITTENSDSTDLCEELIQGESYIKDNIKYPLEISKETIYIKGKKEIEIEIQKTQNGRIFGKTVPSAWTLLNQHHTSSLPLSLRIAFMKKNFTSFDFYFKIALAKNENDFLPFKSLLTAPNVNLHWVTKEGKMGWDVLGLITVKNYYNRFCHGFSSEDDVIEEIPEKYKLKLHNPKRGYIVSGNNKPASFNYLYELRGHHNNFRAHRIEEILLEYKSKKEKIGIKDANKILKDVKDTNAEYFLPKYLYLIEKNSNNLTELKNNEYYLMLKNWNFEMDYNSKTATVFSVLEKLIGYSFVINDISDEFNDKKFMAGSVLNVLHFWNFVTATIDKIYNGEKIRMKECKSFDAKNNIEDDDCEKSLIKVFDELDFNMKKFRDEKGNIIKWGEIHFNYFPHNTFESIPILKYFFNKKKHAGGNRNTIKISRGPNNGKIGDFYGMQSPRLKFICDMKEPEVPYITISEGEGGNLFQEYYNNFDDKHEDAVMIKFDKINFEDYNKQERIINLNKKIILEDNNSNNI